MKKLIFTLCGVLALAACDKAENTMQCGAYEISMTFNGEAADSMNAVINGDSIQLQHAVSGSGARYVGVLNDTEVVLWGKGQEWIMILNDGDAIECK